MIIKNVSFYCWSENENITDQIINKSIWKTGFVASYGLPYKLLYVKIKKMILIFTDETLHTCQLASHTLYPLD